MKASKYITAAIFLFLLASCASVQPLAFKGPNGRTAYFMECSGPGRTLHGCYQKAAEVCLGGYNIIDRASGTGAVPIGGRWVPVLKHSLTIECR